MNERAKEVIGSMTVGLIGGLLLAIVLLILEIVSRHFNLVEEIGSLTFIFASVFFAVVGALGGYDVAKKKFTSSIDLEDES